MAEYKLSATGTANTTLMNFIKTTYPEIYPVYAKVLALLVAKF